MATVLLSFVGRRDPYNTGVNPPTEGAVLSICAEITPDRAYLFPTEDINNPANDTVSNAKDVESQYTAINPGCVFKLFAMRVTDPTDFVELSTQFNEIINDVIADLGGKESLTEHEFHINCSSGTQQMMTIGYVFANTGRIPQIRRWQVKDPNYVPQGMNRTIEILVDVIEENNCLEKINSGLDKQNYYLVKDACEKLAAVACSPARREKARILTTVFDAYIKLDLLNYLGAYNILRDILRDPSSSAHIPPNSRLQLLLIKQKDDLNKILQSPFADESPLNLADLYYNMERSFSREAYADVLARFSRIMEGAAYFILKTEYGLNPRDMQNPLHRGTGNLATLEKAFGYQIRGFIEYKKAFAALALLNYPPYVNSISPHVRNRLEGLRKKRNNTLVAHGMARVTQQDAEKCLPLAKRILPTLIPACEDFLADYPFTLEIIKEILELMIL